MKQLVTFTIFSMVFLYGCAEDSSFSVGVGLGGTGTGIPIGGGNTNPPTPGDPKDEGPILILIDHFELLYSAPQFQNCDGIERTFQFIDKASGQVILDGSKKVLSSMDSKDITNVLLRVKVKNTTSQAVYEYIDACKTPVKIMNSLNGDNKELGVNQRFSCNSDDSYMQIYQMNEQKTYDFDFDLPNDLTTWQFSYQPQYSFGLFPENVDRTQCSVLGISLTIVPIEDKFSKTELHLDDGTVVMDHFLQW
ncbi:hypothetical protein D3C80_907480 [compost metagenome]